VCKNGVGSGEFQHVASCINTDGSEISHVSELGDEEEEHDDGGGERDDAAGEGAAVEVLVHLGVGVQAAELGQEPVHG